MLPCAADGKIDLSFHKGSDHERQLGILIEAAAKGDVRAVRLWHNLNGPRFVDAGDYDGRTALHLAAEEGQLQVVAYIVGLPEVNLEARDRWNHTPLDRAREAGHAKIAATLEKAIIAIMANNKARGGIGGIGGIGDGIAGTRGQ